MIILILFLMILDINYILIKINKVWNTIEKIEFSENKIYEIEKNITEKLRF